MKEEKKQSFLKKLTHKYRFVVLRDVSLEERSSFRLSRLDFALIIGSAFLVLVVVVYLVIAFTPIRQYIPGYADFNTREILIRNNLKIDSLEYELAVSQQYVHNIKNILEDNVEQYANASIHKVDTINTVVDHGKLSHSKEDSILRSEIEHDDYDVLYQESNTKTTSFLASLLFFKPVDGLITQHFNMLDEHFAIDIATKPNASVKSILDGTVTYSDWNVNTGNVIVIQHKDNLLSVYKHNSQLLKKVGNFVHAGEVIAIVGETGEFSQGPHLHFELWYNGSPLNPENYFVF